MIVMSKYIQEIITNDNLVWEKSLENEPQKFLCKLTESVIDELKKNISKPNFNDCELVLLKREIENLKKKFLNQGIGFFIIEGTIFSSFSQLEMEKIYKKIYVLIF